MKRRVEKIEMECPGCWGIGTVGDYGDEIGAPIDCPTCLGSGKVLDFPPEPEFEIEERN
jgi:hypothetical protein